MTLVCKPKPCKLRLSEFKNELVQIFIELKRKWISVQTVAKDIINILIIHNIVPVASKEQEHQHTQTYNDDV